MGGKTTVMAIELILRFLTFLLILYNLLTKYRVKLALTRCFSLRHSFVRYVRMCHTSQIQWLNQLWLISSGDSWVALPHIVHCSTLCTVELLYWLKYAIRCQNWSVVRRMEFKELFLHSFILSQYLLFRICICFSNCSSTRVRDWQEQYEEEANHNNQLRCTFQLARKWVFMNLFHTRTTGSCWMSSFRERALTQDKRTKYVMSEAQSLEADVAEKQKNENQMTLQMNQMRRNIWKWWSI